MAGYKPTQPKTPLFKDSKFNKVPEPTHAVPQKEWHSGHTETPSKIKKSDIGGSTRRSIEEAIKKVKAA